MRRSSGSVRRASAIFLGVLVLVSLAVDGCGEEEPRSSPARKVLPPTRRTMEDFRQHDPFQDSNRRVPNGPDPIHNRGASKSGRSPGRA